MKIAKLECLNWFTGDVSSVFVFIVRQRLVINGNIVSKPWVASISPVSSVKLSYFILAKKKQLPRFNLVNFDCAIKQSNADLFSSSRTGIAGDIICFVICRSNLARVSKITLSFKLHPNSRGLKCFYGTGIILDSID